MFSLKKFIALSLLISGTLSWGFLFQYKIEDMFTNSSSPFLGYVDPVLFYVSAGVSAFGGIFIKRKVDNRMFFLSWITLGVLTTLLLPVFSQTVFTQFLSILLGLSLGLGLPISLALVADRTFIEERARVSGMTIFVTFVLTLLTILIAEFFNFGLSDLILLFALVRSTSFIAFVFDKFDYRIGVCKESQPRPEIKDFFYYIITWSIFILVGILAWNMIPLGVFPSAVAIGMILRFSFIAIFGFLSGFVADRFGRKPPIMIGLIVMAFGFFILGFLGISYLTVIIYLMASGVAWGSLLTIYTVIPGDLSICGSREKLYYFLVVIVLILLPSVPYFPGMANLTRFSSPFSQVLSFILFLAIIPIWRATETLPDIKMRERKFRDHTEKVGKFVSDSTQND